MAFLSDVLVVKNVTCFSDDYIIDFELIFVEIIQLRVKF